MPVELEDRYAARRWDVQGYEAIDKQILATVAYEYPGSDTTVECVYPEFTSVCPWTGLPDFATLSLKYVPKEKLVELKSLKYYLHSFRNVGILQEHAVNRVRQDLVELLAPLYLRVEAEFNSRGGITTRVVSTYDAGAGAAVG